MYDKIISLIKEQGPLLPIEIAGKTNTNSFLAKAYLAELANQGKVKMGEAVGSTNVYFIPGQETQAKSRAEELNNTQRTVATHTGKAADQSPEAVAKREQFKKHFDKALNEPEPPKIQPVKNEETQEWTPISKIEVPKPDLKERITRIFAKPEPVQKTEYKPKIVKSSSDGYIQRVRRMFESGQSRFVEEIAEKKKQAKYIIDFPSSVGAMRFYVVVHNKSVISKSDVALAYTEAANKKLPALIVTNGKLASGADTYAEELGSWFKFKQLK